ncbi:hypothetical protein P872_13725 [Rhodonellum psychrophilum GCM71 = DSM 17998]|uniref:Uncharacterized protein n=1 Tax=Rhodonellum psychrophilum GCM71 = DSM 17998 TaxID=1123057 RepID=U5BUW1_9BACT|nr:hypothetical protein P872_13725 [Rhodonellum psychrophilum GCM71 = DSM 17998]
MILLYKNENSFQPETVLVFTLKQFSSIFLESGIWIFRAYSPWGISKNNPYV